MLGYETLGWPRPALALALASALSLGITGCQRGREGEVDNVCADDGEACLTDDDCTAGTACIDFEDFGRITVLKPLGFLTQQPRPGDEVLIKVVALRSAGQNIEVDADLSPAVAAVVTWRVIGIGTEATLSESASLTDAQGITSVVVNAGGVQGVGFQVEATLDGATPVTFSFQVQLDTRELRLLTPVVLDSVVGRRERLRVQLLRTGGGSDVPVSGQVLQVELIGGPRDNARLEPDPGDLVTVTTDLSGIATVRFETGDVARTYTVVFCGNASCEGVPQREITVIVATTGGAAEGCQYFSDCDAGFICIEGACELANTYCVENDDCAPGFVCGGGRQCEEAPPGDACVTVTDCDGTQICGTAGNCIDDDGCTNDGDCPQDWTCNPGTGACIPDPTPDIPVVNVRGRWLTTYLLDISDTLPGFFTDGLGPVVDFLDLLFRSQLDIDVPIIGPILEGLIDSLIDQYVPDWVPTVVVVLADFIHLFEELTVEGVMTLYQPGNPVGFDVSGEEEWTSAIFKIASLCSGGVQECDQNPACCSVDVVLHPSVNVGGSNNDPDVGVNVEPFNGQVLPPAAGAASPLFTLALYDRDIELELSQLINVLLDIIVNVASNGQWYDFEDFLVDIVPCYDLQIAIDDLACDLTDGSLCSIPGIELFCEAAAGAAVLALTDELGSVELEIMDFEFDQFATVQDDADPVDPTAWALGDPIDPAPMSEIVGTSSTLLFEGDFDEASWWYGER